MLKSPFFAAFKEKIPSLLHLPTSDSTPLHLNKSFNLNTLEGCPQYPGFYYYYYFDLILGLKRTSA